MLLFPIPRFWYVGLAWALLAGVPAVLLALRKNRSAGGWAFLCVLTGLFFGILSFGWVALLASRTKLSMRMKFLSLKVEERLAEALKLPSPVGQDLEKRILMVLAYNPQGLRINALGQGVGLGWRHIADLVEQLVAQGKIRKEEDRYFFNMD
jgi:hypothetical protein